MVGQPGRQCGVNTQNKQAVRVCKQVVEEENATSSPSPFRIVLSGVANSMALGVTDGIDVFWGEEELGPLPQAGTFDVRWQIPGTNGVKKIYVILTDTSSGGTLINVDMKKQDSVVITSAAVNRILITCNSQQIEISGKQISDDTIKPIPVEGIQTDPSNLILSQFYGYNSAYQTVNILQQGYGYWVKVNESGKLTLTQKIH
ncbi:MAG: hypothetical protein ABIK27_07965 [Bacteroidota bacterium]